MSQGFSFRNNNNNLILSAEVPVPFYVGKATKVAGSESYLSDLSTTLPSGFIINYPDQVATFTMEIFSPSIPVVFLRVSTVTYTASGSPTQSAALYSIAKTDVQNASGWFKYVLFCVSSYPGEVGVISPDRNSDAVIAYCFSAPTIASPPDTHGIVLYNSSGERMFHSGLQPLAVRGVANIPIPDFSPGAVPVPHGITGLTNPASIAFANTGFQNTQTITQTGGGCYSYPSCFIDVSTGASGCTQETFCNFYTQQIKITQRFRLYHAITPTAVSFTGVGTGGEFDNPLIPEGNVVYDNILYSTPVIEGSDYD